MKLDLTTGEATIPREIEYIYPCIFSKEDIKTSKIRGTRDGIKGKSPAVDIMLSSDKQFVILTMDCAFYLLEKE